MAWEKLHGLVLRSVFDALDDNGIRFFVIRNYEGLPEKSTAKDVDIMVEPGHAGTAEKLLVGVFKEYGLEYYCKVEFENLFLCRGIDTKKKFAIHIDLMNGYVSMGAEVFPFGELYAQTIPYNGFRVLNGLYNGIMLFIYKQLGYKTPRLKEEYKATIYAAYRQYPAFKEVLEGIVGDALFSQIEPHILARDFETMLSFAPQVTKAIRRYAYKKNLLQSLKRGAAFYLMKTDRVVFRYRKYEKSFGVMAPDGTGKTTFLNDLVEKLSFFYVDGKNEPTSRYHVYHFRPNLLPNLGELGERAKIKKQDNDFTNPHRAKAAGFFSSLARISYYWVDYVVGWNIYARKDVQYDRYTIFDRYSFDLMADPRRTRLRLPLWLRKCYVRLMPHPKITFFLKARPEIIRQRKPELPLDELNRQVLMYEKITDGDKKIVTLDANQDIDNLVGDALQYLLPLYWTKL